MISRVDRDIARTRTPFLLYMIFIVSFFIHIPERIPGLGLIRPDLLLVLLITVLIMRAQLEEQAEMKIAKYLKYLFIFSIVTAVFATWPGTVVKKGIPLLIKAMVFFFFTYKLILSESRLKIIVFIFVAANTFRIIEPLYLNIVHGYWGSHTTFGSGQVNRLAGSPFDVINSNGLAFVIASVLPFYHYLLCGKGFWGWVVYLSSLPVFLYTMQLTLSRTGILAIAIVYGTVFLKSKRKFMLMALGGLGIFIFLGALTDVQRDRYLSIVDSNAESAGSAEGRLTGAAANFDVAMLKPITGHGLGTSAEANANFIGGKLQKAHNLWLEVMQELGIIGLIIFILYVYEIYRLFAITNKLVMNSPTASPFMRDITSAMQVWLAMNFLFSFASYGINSYEWYLFGGFSAAITRIALNAKDGTNGKLKS